MSNPKHTPGPWFIDPESPLDVRTDGVNKMMWIVDAPEGYDRSNADGIREREANAQLIAAAPELLEALKEAAEVLRKYGGIPGDPFKYDKLIIKATGGSK